MPAVAGGTGAAALPLLLFSLINAAAQISEQEQQESNRQDLKGEQQLARVTLPHGQSTEGSVYFLVSPAIGDGTLVVPVLDLDNAKRYLVRLPFTGFKPFTLGSSEAQAKPGQ